MVAGTPENMRAAIPVLTMASGTLESMRAVTLVLMTVAGTLESIPARSKKNLWHSVISFGVDHRYGALGHGITFPFSLEALLQYHLLVHFLALPV